MVKKTSLIEYFSVISDPRMGNKNKHELLDIIVIAICGVICSCNTFVDIEEFGKSKLKWFNNFLKLPNGIPSHDTFGRVFSLISPDELQRAFYEWTQGLSKELNLKEQVIHVDGKFIKASKGATTVGSTGKKTFFGMVNAWPSSAGIALAQRRTDYQKNNEVLATRELLKILNLESCTVTMDAASCQPETTNIIVEKKGDFLVALKKNQRKLHSSVVTIFEEEKVTKDVYETKNEGHGRKESRKCSVVKFKKSFLTDLSKRSLEIGRPEWKNLRCACRVDLERIVKGKKSKEVRYYLSSKKINAKKMLHLMRSHWEVENKLHWVLDVAFNEDASRVRQGFAGENLAVIRQLSLNLIRQEKTSKRSINGKRLKCSWQNDYLERVVLGMVPKNYVI